MLEYWRQWNAMEKTDYSAPAIEIIDVAVEQGFALSGEPINENTPLTW